MRKKIRLAILVGVLLVFRMLFRGSDFFIGISRRTADWIEPVREQIIAFLISLLPEYMDFSIHYIEPVGTIILYISVFAGLVRVAYPKRLWDVLSEAKITRLFRFVISLNIVALFLTWKVYHQMQGELGPMFFMNTWNGYPISGWFVMFGAVYFGILAPVSVGLLLSVPHGGVFSLPERDSDALEFIQGFSAEEVDLDEDVDSALNFWMNQGVYHVLPAYMLGVLFLIFDAIFPTVELLLAFGIVASLSPWELLPSEDVERYDLEQRLAQMLRAATTNIKGLIASVYILGGLLFGVWVLIILLTSHISNFLFLRPQQMALFDWNQVGFICSVIVYSSVSTLLWLSLADRLPWLISAWTEDHTIFKGRKIVQDDKLPSRFKTRLSLPIVWVVLSLSLAYSTYDLAQLVYAILWPMFLVVILAYFVGYESAPMPRSDNKVIAHSIIIQSMASVVIILAEFDSPSVLGFIPTSGNYIFMIILVGALTTFSYFIPESIDKINSNVSLGYDNPNSSDDVVTSGKSGKQRKSRILWLYGSSIVFATLVVFLIIWSMDYVFLGLLYLLTGGWISLAWVYRIDSEKLRDGNEVDITTELRVAILLLLFLFGFGVTLYADPVTARFLNPLSIIVPSLILAIVLGIQLVYEKYFNS